MYAEDDRPPPVLVEAMERLEALDGLDRPAWLVARAARRVVRPGPLEDALTGRWLGHALHPLLTDLPIGFWTSTSFLDLVGRRESRTAATLLLAAGNLAALPTAVTGLAEWLETDPPVRRVGVVHAAANVAGLALYTGSLVARLRRRPGWGTALALGGMGVATVGGYLGGHLAIARKVGTRHPQLALARVDTAG
jgi:uncharacterized membrane protein